MVRGKRATRRRNIWETKVPARKRSDHSRVKNTRALIRRGGIPPPNHREKKSPTLWIYEWNLTQRGEVTERSEDAQVLIQILRDNLSPSQYVGFQILGFASRKDKVAAIATKVNEPALVLTGWHSFEKWYHTLFEEESAWFLVRAYLNTSLTVALRNSKAVGHGVHSTSKLATGRVLSRSVSPGATKKAKRKPTQSSKRTPRKTKSRKKRSRS